MRRERISFMPSSFRAEISKILSCGISGKRLKSSFFTSSAFEDLRSALFRPITVLFCRGIRREQMFFSSSPNSRERSIRYKTASPSSKRVFAIS